MNLSHYINNRSNHWLFTTAQANRVALKGGQRQTDQAQGAATGATLPPRT